MNKEKLRFFEIGFFLFYFIILPVVSTFEYQLKSAPGHQFVSSQIIGYYIVTGLLYSIPYFIYYQFLVKDLFFRKKYRLFIFSLLLLIIVIETYLRLIDIAFSQFELLPDTFQKISQSYIKFHGGLRQNLTVTITNLISLSALAFFIQTVKDRINILKLKEQHAILELEQLKAQIQPHFFFNTLNNIYSLALERSNKTPETVLQLSQLMRYIIYECRKPKVPLQKELDFINNYVRLEQIRHENIDIVFDLQCNDPEITIEPLLFIPLIENAFKHFGNLIGERAYVHIEFALIEKELILQVKNSKGNHIKDTGGIGLQNVIKRLDLLYPENYSLNITDSEKNYELQLTISLSNE